MEIETSSIHLLDGTDGVDLAVQRSENGRLTSACKETLLPAIRDFLRSRTGRGPMSALCAVGAQGVTMRRLRLPKCSRDELEGVLLLQIESEFPLPPDQLAWGYFEVSPADSLNSTSSGGPEVLVFAVRGDSLEEYSDLMNSAGIQPSFTLAPFARKALIPEQSNQKFSMLHVASPQCELACFEQGTLSSVRLLSLGLESLPPARVEGTKENYLEAPLATAVAALAKCSPEGGLGELLLFTGDLPDIPAFAESFEKVVEGKVRCRVLPKSDTPGHSASTLGLARLMSHGGIAELPLFRIKRTASEPLTMAPIPWKWIARAAALLICALGLRYLEPAFSKARMTPKLAVMKRHRDTLPGFEKELSFLQYLEKNHALIQDTLYVVANAAPQGTRIDSMTISRKGEVSLRTSVAPPTQAVAFRSKLTDSDFFSTVVVEEQSPSPDRQKTTLRISAVPKPHSARPVIQPAAGSGPPKEARVEKAKPVGVTGSAAEKAFPTSNAIPAGLGASKTNK